MSGSTTRKHPSGATPTGLTTLPSSLIWSGSVQSTQRDHSASANSAESLPEAHEQSLSVSVADRARTALNHRGQHRRRRRCGQRVRRWRMTSLPKMEIRVSLQVFHVISAVTHHVSRQQPLRLLRCLHGFCVTTVAPSGVCGKSISFGNFGRECGCMQ